MRYKFVIHAYSGNLEEQDLKISSQYLSNNETDVFLTEKIKRRDFFILINVFLAYYE